MTMDRDAAVRERRWRRPLGTIATVTAVGLLLHLVWFRFLAGSGGDLAAQDAWSGFALAHPSSAYDFAWYGGMQPASYSLISPYVMALIGVRETMVLAGTVSTGLGTLLLTQTPAVARPGRAGVYVAAALTGNAVSGRVTFGLGITFGLAAMAVVFAWPARSRTPGVQWLRGGLAGLLAALAAAASPVAGLFLGLVAAALWLRRRRRAALALGATPALVVGGTALLFPFHGVQPFHLGTALLPVLLALACWFVLPRRWRLVRVCSLVYAAAVLLLWLVPSPVGTNVVRMALLFAGVVLVAATSGAWWTSAVSRWLGRRVGLAALVGVIATATIWQGVIARKDVIGAATAASIDSDVQGLVAQLDARGATMGRVEVVPSRSHREASALAPYVNLARGWNRQADVVRNPLFYRTQSPFDGADYEQWLRRWAVRFVVLPVSTPDYAALREAHLVRSGLPFLHEVWSDPTWTLYEFDSPAPMVSAPATLRYWDATGMTIDMPEAGSVVLRIAWSPWLALVDDQGRKVPPAVDGDSCLDPQPATAARPVQWVVLRAATPGTYRIAAPYELPRGSGCPEPSGAGRVDSLRYFATGVAYQG